MVEPSASRFGACSVSATGITKHGNLRRDWSVCDLRKEEKGGDVELKILALKSGHLKSPDLCGELDALGRVAGHQQTSRSGDDSLWLTMV